MNRHTFLDVLSIEIKALIRPNGKMFCNSADSIAPSILLDSAKLEIPEINGEGTHRVEINMKSGKYYADFRVEKWLGSEFPTIIYHHGNNESPFDYDKPSKSSFYHIFVTHNTQFECNLIVIRATFHDLSYQAYQKKLEKLEHFVSMFTVSTRLIEALIQEIRKHNSERLIVSGLSLGGFVTNYHRAKYNTADVYIPMLSGTRLGDMFTISRYRKLTALKDNSTSENVRTLLNFSESFNAVPDKNVYPLLALYDKYVEYDVQKHSYIGHPLEVIKRGHITGVIHFTAFREHVLYIMNNAGEMSEKNV